MKVLVVGSGGREHALAWAIAKSPRVEKVYVAPGNGGTSQIAENVPLSAENIEDLLGFACERGVDLTVVGPEAPLVAGIVDRFRAAGRRCFGPTRAAARLEGSKVFAKEFMKRHGIPTADFAVFDDAERAEAHVRSMGAPIVVKADGLAAGKGAFVAKTVEEAVKAIDTIMVDRQFGAAGDRVVIEECLAGEEMSVHAVCGGSRAVLLPTSQDHKRIFDNDEGPNTGGMGAYAPVPRFQKRELHEHILESIVGPTLRGMQAEGSPFSGVLYVGLMMTPNGPRVLEYNVRFGDPETQVLVPLVKSDMAELLYASSEDSLPRNFEIHEGRFAATVVVASRGYPGSYAKGFVVEGLEGAEDERRVVFHAGTERKSGKVVTSGGRVLSVTAWGGDLAEVLRHAYAGVARIRFEGAYWRRDIGRRAL